MLNWRTDNNNTDFNTALQAPELNNDGGLGSLSNVNYLVKNNYQIIYYWRPYAQLLTQISKDGKIDFEVFMKTRKPGDGANQSSSKHKSKQKPKHGQFGQQMWTGHEIAAAWWRTRISREIKEIFSRKKEIFLKDHRDLVHNLKLNKDMVLSLIKQECPRVIIIYWNILLAWNQEEWHYQAKTYFPEKIGQPGKDRSMKLLGQILKNMDGDANPDATAAATARNDAVNTADKAKVAATAATADRNARNATATAARTAAAAAARTTAAATAAAAAASTGSVTAVATAATAANAANAAAAATANAANAAADASKNYDSAKVDAAAAAAAAAATATAAAAAATSASDSSSIINYNRKSKFKLIIST